VLILAKNEEKNIQACIKSVLFADEIIVIDDFSTDHTAEIAKELGAKVIQRAMEGNWGAQQTFAIQQAASEWIYFIDADERMTPELANEVKKAVKMNKKYTYRNARLNYFWGQELRHGGWYPDYGVHLLPKEGSYVTGFVHPQIHHNYPEKKIHQHLIHYPYRDWEHYFHKLNLYTQLAAKKNKEKGKQVNFFFDIMLRPWVAFCKMYILKAGWRDGKIGFILASFHFCYTMAKYVKLYYIDKTNYHVGE
jgi:glycosyltransferase involved in cell wall biosynthesis